MLQKIKQLIIQILVLLGLKAKSEIDSVEAQAEVAVQAIEIKSDEVKKEL